MCDTPRPMAISPEKRKQILKDVRQLVLMAAIIFAFGGYLGGASMVRAALRVTIGGGLAMGVTAAIGRLLGVSVG